MQSYESSEEERGRKRKALLGLKSDLERYLGNIVMRIGKVNEELARLDDKGQEPATPLADASITVFEGFNTAGRLMKQVTEVKHGRNGRKRT